MSATSSVEPFGRDFDFEIRELEDSATGTVAFEFLPMLNVTTDNKETERKEKILDLLFQIPKPTTGLTRLETVSTTIATKGDQITELGDYQHCEISEMAEAFISRQKQVVKYKKEIFEVAERVSDFLRRERIDGTVCIDLFTDPEYSEWVEPKVQIKVRKELLQKTYDVFDDLLAYSFSGISQKTLKRLSVTIDSS